VLLSSFIGCGKKEEDTSKNNFQVLADKEKELNDREARIRLKEIELEEREKKLNGLESGQSSDTSMTSADTSGGEKKDLKEIQKEITKKFENPATTVKDYYEYIQRAINETGNFDSNMKKAHNYYPTRSADKMKAAYKNTKSFTVVNEPKVISQKDENAVVTSKVKQIEVVKKDGKDQEVTRTMTVTYNLKANSKGEWEIVSNNVKIDK
jgi:hypothetical protein